MTISQKITYTYGENPANDFHQVSRQRALPRLIIFSIAVSAIMVISFLLAIFCSYIFYFTAGAAFGVLLAVFMLTLQALHGIKKSHAGLDNVIQVQATLEEQGYTTEVQRCYQWQNMSTLYQCPTSWVIVLKDNQSLALPIQNIPQETQLAFLEKARAAGCEVK